jgi:hypothetical protein
MLVGGVNAQMTPPTTEIEIAPAAGESRCRIQKIEINISKETSGL